MSLILSLLVAAAHAACPAPEFVFQGQPDCVALSFADGHTQATSQCAAPILVDQSVQLRAGESILPPGGTATLRDLSFFTLGLEGRLYRVVAVLAPCEEADARVAQAE